MRQIFNVSSSYRTTTITIIVNINIKTRE